MSTEELFSGAPVLDDRTERARRAVKVFRTMQPQLTGYARAITRKRDVSVRLAQHGQSSGMTDGKIIYFVPPIALGDMRPHKRALCDKRDENLQQRCEACRIREQVLAIIYHEMAHICFDSMAPVSDRDKVDMTRRAVEEGGSTFAQALKERYDKAPGYVKNSYKGLSGLFSEFLPLIVNALEDARVNREMFSARPGTKAIFEAKARHVFAEGVEQRNDKGELVHVQWRDYPLNLQAIIGCFVRVSGYEYSGWLHPKVEADLLDPSLNQVLGQMNTIRSPGEVYNLSFKVLDELRKLGYCKLENDPEEPEPEPESESTPEEEENDDNESEALDESEQPDADAGEGEGSDGDVSGEPSDEAGAEDEPGEGEPEGGEAPEGDGAEPGDGDEAVPGSDGGDSPNGDEPADGEPGDGDSGADPGAGTDGGEPADQDDPSDEASGGEGSDTSDESGVPDGGEDEADRGGEGSESGLPGSDEAGRGGELSDGEAEDDLNRGGGGGGGDGAEESAEAGPQAADEPDFGDEDGSSGGEGDSGGEPGAASGVPGTGADLGADRDDRDGEGVAPGDDPGDTGDGAEPGDVDPFDSLADEGEGGVEDEASAGTLPAAGRPLEIAAEIAEWLGHGEASQEEKVEEAADKQAVAVAIVQGLYFETPSAVISGVNEFRYDDIDPNETELAWRPGAEPFIKQYFGIDGEFDPAESILGPALMRMRVAFSDNQRAKDVRNLKAGKINGRVLGKRVFHDDPRLFRRRQLPGKRSYFVVIGMDVSGSNAGESMVLLKRSVMAQATLLARMGIDFAIYAHSGSDSKQGLDGVDLDIYIVKEGNEPWSDKVQNRLRELGPDSVNIDGHALEYLRKRADEANATDVIILYYSDGKMPAYNYEEELQILQREIKVCRQKNYTLLGVGIRTDSPARHGLDTVQVDEDADVVKVVRHLERELLR